MAIDGHSSKVRQMGPSLHLKAPAEAQQEEARTLNLNQENTLCFDHVQGSFALVRLLTFFCRREAGK